MRNVLYGLLRQPQGQIGEFGRITDGRYLFIEDGLLHFGCPRIEYWFYDNYKNKMEDIFLEEFNRQQRRLFKPTVSSLGSCMENMLCYYLVFIMFDQNLCRQSSSPL
jgi:hypothetical protein